MKAQQVKLNWSILGMGVGRKNSGSIKKRDPDILTIYSSRISISIPFTMTVFRKFQRGKCPFWSKCYFTIRQESGGSNMTSGVDSLQLIVKMKFSIVDWIKALYAVCKTNPTSWTKPFLGIRSNFLFLIYRKIKCEVSFCIAGDKFTMVIHSSDKTSHFLYVHLYLSIMSWHLVWMITSSVTCLKMIPNVLSIPPLVLRISFK